MRLVGWWPMVDEMRSAVSFTSGPQCAFIRSAGPGVAIAQYGRGGTGEPGAGPVTSTFGARPFACTTTCGIFTWPSSTSV